MEGNFPIFWDRAISKDKAMKVLKDEANPRFIEFAALLLSRANDPKAVFGAYLSKELFCKYWARIKRRMRQNKWNDSRIIFWDEVYKVARKGVDIAELSGPKRHLAVDSEIKAICDRIRQVRKQAGLTQAELAKKSKFSQQTISFVEQGYVNISLQTLKRIASALNLKVTLVSRDPVS